MGDASFSLKVDTSAMQRVIRDTPGQVDKLLDTVAEMLKNDIVLSFGASPAPSGGPPGVDTGALRAGIDWMEDGPERRLLHDSVEYGVYLELGSTRHQYVWPFMGPAFERLRPQLPGIVRDFGIVK